MDHMLNISVDAVHVEVAGYIIMVHMHHFNNYLKSLQPSCMCLFEVPEIKLCIP